MLAPRNGGHVSDNAREMVPPPHLPNDPNLEASGYVDQANKLACKQSLLAGYPLSGLFKLTRSIELNPNSLYG
jgi:hypothetical protein